MNILKDIRKGSFSAEFKPVELGNQSLIKGIIFDNIVSQNIKVTDESMLETLKNIRQNKDHNVSIKDKANILGFTNNLKDNIKKTKENIKSMKEKFIKEVKNSNDKYTFVFSDKSELVKYATNVFQTKKDHLTVDDFFTLIELKKQIELDQLTKYKEENV